MCFDHTGPRVTLREKKDPTGDAAVRNVMRGQPVRSIEEPIPIFRDRSPIDENTRGSNGVFQAVTL